MVSGHGAFGGRGRCYSLWMDFMKCLSDKTRISFEVCQDQREDYLECLHHRKLAIRLDQIRKQKEKLIREGKLPKE